MTSWGGRRAQAWSAAVLQEHGTTCWLRLDGCTLVATTGDHVLSRHTHPHLAYDVSNGRPACLHCNSSRGATERGAARVVVDKRAVFEAAATPGRPWPSVSPPGPHEDGDRADHAPTTPEDHR